MKALRFFNKYLFPIIVIALVWYQFKIWGAILTFLLFMVYWIYKGRKAFYTLFAGIENRKQNFKKSAEWYEKAYLADRSNFEAAADAAYIYLWTNNFEKAKSLIENIDPNQLQGQARIKTITNIAIILWKNGDIDKAVELFEGLLTEGMLSTSLYGNLPYLVMLQGNIDKAFRLAKEAYEYNNDDIAIIENLAKLHHVRGEMLEARELFEKMASKKPVYPEAWYNLGLFLSDEGETDKAKEAFEKALNCNFSFLSNVDKETIQKELEGLNHEKWDSSQI